MQLCSSGMDGWREAAFPWRVGERWRRKTQQSPSPKGAALVEGRELHSKSGSLFASSACASESSGRVNQVLLGKPKGQEEDGCGEEEEEEDLVGLDGNREQQVDSSDDTRSSRDP